MPHIMAGKLGLTVEWSRSSVTTKDIHLRQSNVESSSAHLKNDIGH